MKKIIGLCFLPLLLSLAVKAQDTFEFKAPGLQSLSLDGQIRLRGEWRRPLSYGGSARASWGDVFQRTRLGLKARVSDHLGAVVEIQDSRLWGEDASLAADNPGLTLRQGFLTLDGLCGGKVSVRAGRMALPALGDQRLISALDWSNVGRAWEALHASFRSGSWSAEAFAADTRNSLRTAAGGRDVLLLSGLQVRRGVGEGNALEALALGRTLREGGFDGTASLRALGKKGRVQGAAEGILQTTDGSKSKAESWACAVKAEVEATPRLSIVAEHSAASGDPDPADGVRRTFDPILSFAHYYLGHADLVGWKNVRSVMAGLRFKLRDNFFIHLDGHGFSLVDTRDSWYGASGAAIRTDPTGQASKDLGKELDLYLKGKIQKGLSAWAGYSRFQPGDYVKNTGMASPTDWAFLQTGVDW